MDRLTAFAEDIGRIQVSVAKIETTVAMGFAEHNKQLIAQALQLDELSKKTDIALMPIKVAKFIATFTAGASAVSGVMYALYQIVAGGRIP